MQTLTIGRSTYKLSPSRNVGELQAKLSKFTGKTKKTIIAKERRSYPVFIAGQSTAEYVAAFYDENFRGEMNFCREVSVIDRFFAPLNSKPCTLYSGADLHEIMTDKCADPAPNDPAPAAAAPTRYALVNRPAGLGTVPRGLEYQVDPRPQEGAPHHSMARHGILVCDRTLTDAECRSFELAPLLDAAAVDTIADTIAADLADYAEEYVTQSAEDTEEFSRAVLQRAARGALRVSIGDPAGLVSSVIYRLRAIMAKAAPVDPAPVADVPAPIEIAAPVAADLKRTPLQYLPIFVRLAIEWVDSNSEMRNTQALDDMIDAYAKTYGSSCDDADRTSAHYFCARRFWDFLVIPADPAPTDPAPTADGERVARRALALFQTAVSAIAASAPDRIPSARILASEAERFERSAEKWHSCDGAAAPELMQERRETAHMLREAAEIERARDPERAAADDVRTAPSEPEPAAPVCKHPPARLFAWTARDARRSSGEVFCVACCDCGDVLKPTQADEAALVPAPLPRVIYSEFIRSAIKREAPMTV